MTKVKAYLTNDTKDNNGLKYGSVIKSQFQLYQSQVRN